MVNHYTFTHVLLFIKDVHTVTNIPPPEGQTLTHPAISWLVGGALPVALSQIIARISFSSNIVQIGYDGSKKNYFEICNGYTERKMYHQSCNPWISSYLMPYIPLL